MNLENYKIKCITYQDSKESIINIEDVLYFIRIHHSGQNGIYCEFATKDNHYVIRGKDDKKLRTFLLDEVKNKGETKKRFVQTGFGSDGQSLGYYKYWIELKNPISLK